MTDPNSSNSQAELANTSVALDATVEQLGGAVEGLAKSTSRGEALAEDASIADRRREEQIAELNGEVRRLTGLVETLVGVMNPQALEVMGNLAEALRRDNMGTLEQVVEALNYRNIRILEEHTDALNQSRTSSGGW
jgi:hypothetical protein